jgi:hypothetical protein
MIESFYWKEDLLSHARRLRSVVKPKKWSEKLMVNFEKELTISFFLIRKLFEVHKVSSRSTNYRAPIYFFTPTGKKITRLNHTAIDEIYDLENEKKVNKSIHFLTNQFIHSCTIFAYREEDRNWGGVYVCSDRERNKTIYRIPVGEIIKIFELVGNDYTSSIRMTWDEEEGDYSIKVD